MEKTVHYLETHSQNPYYNLAFEEYVLCHRTEGDYLLLWQNDNTIVVGRNQNTEAEINRAFVEQHHINVVRRSTGGGDAITSVQVDWQQIDGDQLGRQQQAQYIMEQLLGACKASGFTSPVPDGTALRSCTVTGGTVSVDLSSEYDHLTGIDRTIADYCITLSLLQLTGIYAVRITVMDVSPANHEEVYTSAQVLLTSPEDIVRTVEVTLYFPDELGNLTAEERRLTVYEGETPAEAVVKALTERPMDIYAGLERLLPKGFTALAASVEDGTCYLNLPSSVVSLLPEDSQKQRIMLEGLVNSLCSLEGVEQVQILLNGDYQMLLGTQPVSRPLLPTE